MQVVFEAERGNDYKGDIAIDEIVTSTTYCDTVPSKAKYERDPYGKYNMYLEGIHI